MNFLYRVLQLILFALPSALFIGLVHSAKLSKSNCSRVKTSLARWRDIILYAVIADFVLLTAYVVVTKPTDPGKESSKDGSSSPIGTLAELRTDLTNSLGNWFEWALLALAIIAFVYFLEHIRVWKYDRKISHYFKYPPLTVSIWLAPVVAAISLSVISAPKSISWVKELLGNTEMVWLAFIFTGSLLTPYLKRLIFSQSDTEGRAASDEDFLNWIKEEKPCEKDNALFDQKHEVQRLLNVFKNHDIQEPIGKRIAVEGPRGIGKSTIAKRLAGDISKIRTPDVTEGEWMTVIVDGWGRDQSSIEEQVLGLVIEKLSEHTDTFSLRNIPRVYSDAIKSLEGPLRLLDAFAPEYDTEELLDRLHGIFDLLNLNLLLIIEDPDRNYNAQTLNQLASLIDRFKPRDHFRFNALINYSIAEIDKKINVLRESGVYERAEDKITEIEALDRICEHKFILSTVDCLSELNRFIAIWQKRALEHGAPFTYDKFPVRGLAPQRIKTPRDFKAIMRHVDRLWQKDILLGEVHLNDLIAICCISRVDPIKHSQIAESVGQIAILDKIQSGTSEAQANKLLTLSRDDSHISENRSHNNEKLEKLFNQDNLYRYFQNTEIELIPEKKTIFRSHKKSSADQNS